MNERSLPVVAGLLGALGVGLGAFGAHALRSSVDPHALGVWQTATRYHLVHAVLLIVLTAYARATGRSVATPAWLLIAGTMLFSGSLYALVLTNARWLGAITPLGGLTFIAAWVASGITISRGSTRAKKPGDQ